MSLLLFQIISQTGVTKVFKERWELGGGLSGLLFDLLSAPRISEISVLLSPAAEREPKRVPEEKGQLDAF